MQEKRARWFLHTSLLLDQMRLAKPCPGHPGRFCTIWFMPSLEKRSWNGCGKSDPAYTIRPDSGCMLAVMAITGRNQNASGSNPECVLGLERARARVCVCVCVCVCACGGGGDRNQKNVPSCDGLQACPPARASTEWKVTWPARSASTHILRRSLEARVHTFWPLHHGQRSAHACARRRGEKEEKNNNWLPENNNRRRRRRK